MEQIYNPYLPLTEYIPDGEPHVFDGRLYVYGSHDRANGKFYCEDHYEVWSAPVDNLKDWRSEGTSYLRSQDPSNRDDTMQLWAPDVTRGPDGRYYMYYCFSFFPEIGVAVSDTPAGPFSFYGHVHYPSHIMEGKTLQEYMPFDPAVLTDDDGRVYLYYGFAPGGEKEINLPDPDCEEMKDLPETEKQKLRKARSQVFSPGAMAAELEPDMLTLKSVPRELIPSENDSAGTSFEGHGFFEASSIRKIQNRYYFVYSSHKSHELCYAVSDHPMSGFAYGGVIISNGDIGLHGNSDAVQALSNNHGGIAQIRDEYYIFYHRSTNGTEFSRQGCAEKIEILPDGSIQQVEVTSCGLNGGPLTASGSYPASIACRLTSPRMPEKICYPNDTYQQAARITQRQNVSLITDIQDGTVLGYKYFHYGDPFQLLLEISGTWNGSIMIAHDPEGRISFGEMEFHIQDPCWTGIRVPCRPDPGDHGLYMIFRGTGTLEMKQFTFLVL